jgi:hypothetical protein
MSLAETVRGWPRTQPWRYSLDSAIAGLAPGVVADGENGDGTIPPKVVDDHVLVGVWWWDTHTVEERRQALMDAVRWNMGSPG